MRATKSPEDLLDLEDLRIMAGRVLGGGSKSSAPDRTMLLEVAAATLRSLAAMRDRSRGPAWIDQAADRLSFQLIDLANKWRSGEVKHLEEALEWKRPPKWSQKTAQKHAAIDFPLYRFIDELREAGGVTKSSNKSGANVFEKAGAKYGVSPSTAEKIYARLHTKYGFFEKSKSHKKLLV